MKRNIILIVFVFICSSIAIFVLAINNDIERVNKNYDINEQCNRVANTITNYHLPMEIELIKMLEDVYFIEEFEKNPKDGINYLSDAYQKKFTTPLLENEGEMIVQCKIDFNFDNEENSIEKIIIGKYEPVKFVMGETLSSFHTTSNSSVEPCSQNILSKVRFEKDGNHGIYFRWLKQIGENFNIDVEVVSFLDFDI